VIGLTAAEVRALALVASVLGGTVIAHEEHIEEAEPQAS